MVRRGLRGRAGSGKGVRTLVEHFNLFFSREYNVERNHVHLNLSNTGNESVSGDEPTSTGASAVVETIEGFGATYGESVDWDSGRLELKPVVIPRPTCVIPHQQPRGFVRSNASSGWGAVHPGGFDQGILHDGMTHQANSVVSSYEDILFVCDLCAQFYTPTPVEGTIPSHGTVSKPSMTTEPVTVTSAVPGAPSPLGRSPMISARKVRPHTLIPILGNLKFHHSPLNESYMYFPTDRKSIPALIRGPVQSYIIPPHMENTPMQILPNTIPCITIPVIEEEFPRWVRRVHDHGPMHACVQRP